MTILEQTYHQNTFLGALSVRPRFSCMPLHGNYSCRCVERTTKYILLSQCSTLVLITVWTVLQTVLTATFNSYGDRQISTPYKINTPEPIDKNFGTVDYVREGTSYTKFGTNPPTEGFWANWWNITKKLFLFIPFFSQARAQVRPVDGFLHAIAQKTWNHVRMCLLGSEWCAPKFWE